jgi:hypothetical protein
MRMNRTKSPIADAIDGGPAGNGASTPAGIVAGIKLFARLAIKRAIDARIGGRGIGGSVAVIVAY